VIQVAVPVKHDLRDFLFDRLLRRDLADKLRLRSLPFRSLNCSRSGFDRFDTATSVFPVVSSMICA